MDHLFEKKTCCIWLGELLLFCTLLLILLILCGLNVWGGVISLFFSIPMWYADKTEHYTIKKDGSLWIENKLKNRRVITDIHKVSYLAKPGWWRPEQLKIDYETGFIVISPREAVTMMEILKKTNPAIRLEYNSTPQKAF